MIKQECILDMILLLKMKDSSRNNNEQIDNKNVTTTLACPPIRLFFKTSLFWLFSLLQGAKLIRQTYRFVNKIGVDPSTGLLTSKPPPVNHYNAINLERALAYEPPPERYQDHIDYLSHFVDCAAENRLSDDHVNLVKQVIEELTRGRVGWGWVGLGLLYAHE